MTLPPVVISAADRERLVSIAKSALMSDRPYPPASNLLSEIGRATVLPADAVPQSIIVMGSEVEIHDDVRKSCFRVRLVYPDEKASGAEAVSVLTPLGVALIGLAEGHSFHWCAATGDPSKITIVRVLLRRTQDRRSGPTRHNRRVEHS
jgi:regulator of nucleoside diphosphate kinase